MCLRHTLYVCCMLQLPSLSSMLIHHTLSAHAIGHEHASHSNPIRHTLCACSKLQAYTPCSIQVFQSTCECATTGPIACAVLPPHVPYFMRMHHITSCACAKVHTHVPLRCACARLQTCVPYYVCMRQTPSAYAKLHEYAPHPIRMRHTPCAWAILQAHTRYSIHIRRTTAFACAMLNVHNPRSKLW